MPELKLDPTNLDELRVFFDQGGIYELARPMEYLLNQAGQPLETKVILTDDDSGGEFKAYWHQTIGRANHRLLVIQSNLSSIAGLHLGLPVELKDYKTSPMGTISAAMVPRLVKGRSRVGHYLKHGAGIEIGSPDVPVSVQQIASGRLLKACGVEKIEELEGLSSSELSAA